MFRIPSPCLRRIPFVFASAALAVGLLGCSDDSHGPTIGAPEGPGPVIVEGGGSPGTGGGGGAGIGGGGNVAGGFNEGGTLNAGGNGFTTGGTPFGSGGAVTGQAGLGAGGGVFGSAGASVPFGSGGQF